MVTAVVEKPQVEFEAWRDLEFTVEGISSVLMHNWRGNLRAETGLAKKKEKPTPEQEAPKYVYRDAEGHLALPATHMRKSMIDAAGRFPAPGVRYRYSYIIKGALQLDPIHTMFTLHAEDGTPIDDYEVNVERVVIGNAGIERGRPEIMPWFMTCRYLIDMSLTDVESLQKVIATAGRMHGVGDYRPSTGGWHGAFRLVSIALR